MADALTSFTAIFALLAAKFFGWIWMDPIMGIAGSILVAHWSIGLLRSTSHTLLDYQVSNEKLDSLRQAIETQDEKIVDLHVWAIGPGINCAAISVLAEKPADPEIYKARIPDKLQIVHSLVEVHRADKTS